MKIFLFWLGAIFIFCNITLSETLTKIQYITEYNSPSVIKKYPDKIVIKCENEYGISSLKSIYIADMSEDLRTYLNIDKETYNKYVDQKTNEQNDLVPIADYQSFTTAINNDNGEQVNRSSQSIPYDNNKIIGQVALEKDIYEEPPRGGHLSAEESKKNIIQHIINATVLITTDKGTGAGFLVNNNGLIVTNYHVIADSNEVNIELHSGEKYSCNIIYGNKNLFQKDIAFVNIKGASNKSFLALLKDSPRIGSTVFVVGHPLRHNWTYSNGELKSNSYSDANGRKEVLISADIFPGNSGGPICNEQGEVIGVSTFLQLPSFGNLDKKIVVNYTNVFKGGISVDEVIPSVNDINSLKGYKLSTLAQYYTACVFMLLLEILKPIFAELKNCVEHAKITDYTKQNPITKTKPVYHDRGFTTQESYTDYETVIAYKIFLDNTKLCESIRSFKIIKQFTNSENFLQLIKNNSKNADKFKFKIINGFKSLIEMTESVSSEDDYFIRKKNQLEKFRQNYNETISCFYGITEECCYCFDKYGEFYPGSETYKGRSENLKKEYQDFYIRLYNE